MIPRIIEHSVGMVSVEVENLRSSETSIEFLRGTKLFEKLIEVVGMEGAMAALTQNASTLPERVPDLKVRS